MKRRRFIALVGGVVALPLGARAQQPARAARIGFLGTASATGWANKVDAFRAGLRDLGYVEGKNIVIEFRWANGQYNRLQSFAAELVALNVDVIVTQASGVLAAQKATKTIPVVMAALGDAVGQGAVQSLAHPGGNITGSTFFNPELASKRVELLKEAFPQIKRVGVVFIPALSGPLPMLDAMRATAKSLEIEILEFPVRGPEEFESAFTAIAGRDVDAVAMNESPILLSNSKAIVAVVAKSKLPAVGFPEFAEAGGLMAYGVNIVELHRRAAVFVDKILKGSKPGDLPVEQSTKFHLVVNLATAKTLSLTLPQSLLARADEVIE
jgi:putative tryptophan/tyrosine transport system substrate-binding protein